MSNRKVSCLFLFFWVLNFVQSAEENVEVSCNINVKKAVQCVSEKFLSITVDPAVLLAGVNLSENSLRLAKRLNPAYIRIAGPSTQFVKYVDQDDRSGNFLSDDGNSVKITPAVWFGVNEWLKLAKLTPIFGVNDVETARGLWNPKTTLPLFEIAEKLNVSCYWQLGYDSTDKNETRYKQDINIFHYILTAYGARNDTWKIIGSDISSMPPDRMESIMIEENDVLEAVMWEPSGRTLETFPEKDAAYKILLHQSAKPRAKMWTTVPKSSKPITFGSALLWAKQVGNAAKMGYNVIFRQPRVYELFTDTPIYWFSLLHKTLMGCHVLDTKSSIFQEETDIFAHCTRKQNSFVRRGALTILVVNNRPNKYKVKVKLGNSLPEKSMEIQAYILTSDTTNSTNIYLNGKLLTTKLLQEKNPFEPKIRRTKTTSHLLLSLPPLSIGFFVLPGARIPVCIDKEKERRLLLEEIEENQNNGLSAEIALQLGSRASFSRNNPLDEIMQKLKEEMKSDEKYYKKDATKSKSGSTIFSQQAAGLEKTDGKIDEKGRKHFIDRVKFAEKHKKALDRQKKGEGLKKFLLDKSKTPKIEQKPKNMDLTSDEMEKILKDRAIERAAKKNIVFTDEELEALIRKASKNFNKQKDKRSLPQEHREERDINRHMLEKYSQNNQQPFDFENQPFHQKQDMQNHKIRGKRDVRRVKKPLKKRGINFDLLDLKSKIAEHKKFWQDKKDDLLGNSNLIKENLLDKINELKSKYRIKRDINFDGLKTKTKTKKSKKAKKSKDLIENKEDIEATIRKAGQTSDEILEELEHARVAEDINDDHEEVNQGEIFAELANSEDLEDELLLNDDYIKPKKLTIFDKKTKIDPFAVAHPTLDIVEPSRRKSKKKKIKADDKLQFLTSSEEFTDIEDDLHSIHEYYGPMHKSGKKKGSAKGEVQEMNEFYEIPKLFKREVHHKFSPKDIPRKKRSVGFTILEMAKYEDDLQPEDFLQDILFNPVLEMPEIEEFYKYEIKELEEEARKLQEKNNVNHETDGNTVLDEKSKNHTQTNSSSISLETNEDILGEKPNTIIEVVHNNLQTLDDPALHGDTTNEINKTEKTNSNSILDKDNEDNDDDDENASYHTIIQDNQNDNNISDANDEYDQINDIKPEDVSSNNSSNDKSKNSQQNDDTDNNSQSLSWSKSLESEDITELNNQSQLVNEEPQVIRKKRDTTDIEHLEEEIVEKKKTKTPKKHIKKPKKIGKKEHSKKGDSKKGDNRKGDSKKEDSKKEDHEEEDDHTKEDLHKKDHTKKDHKKLSKSKPKNENKNFAEQMNSIKEKLQDRKDEIDKMIKKQKEMELDIKNQWKSKIAKKKKKSKSFKGEESLNNEVILSRSKVPNKKNIKKRSIFNPKHTFGNYQPITTDLRAWKPSDITSLRRDIHFPKKMLPPNDHHIFKNIFNNNRPFNLNRRRRFIDNDADLLENEIDSHFNEITKDAYDSNTFVEKAHDLNFENNRDNKLKEIIQNYKDETVLSGPDTTVIEVINKTDNNKETDVNTAFQQDILKIEGNKSIESKNNIATTTEKNIEEHNDKSNMKDGDYKFKLPNNDEFEIIKAGDDTEIKFLHHEHQTTEKNDDLMKNNATTFIPKIMPRAMKPFEDIEKFFGNVKELFDKVGREVKYYFNNIGLNI